MNSTSPAWTEPPWATLIWVIFPLISGATWTMVMEVVPEAFNSPLVVLLELLHPLMNKKMISMIP